MEWSSFFYGWAAGVAVSWGLNYLSNRAHKREVDAVCDHLYDSMPEVMAKKGIMYVTTDESEKIKLSRNAMSQ